MTETAHTVPEHGGASSGTGRLSPLAQRVAKRVSRLQSHYLRDQAGAVATLARLRHAVGSAPGEDASVWAETLDLVDDLGQDTDEPTVQEWAVHLALTLYATHQQSQRELQMHKPGPSLGAATRELANARGGDEASEAVLRRFHMLGTSRSLGEVSHHARGLVSQFRAAHIPLDYGLLTDHLVKLQDPLAARSVRRAWGRDYYRTPRTTSIETATATQGDPA